MSEKGFRVEIPIQIKRDPRAQKVLVKEQSPPEDQSIPRIARLLALAHKWEGMVRRGEVKDYAEIGRLTGLSRARVTQVCDLTLLAPGVQELILRGRAYALPCHTLRPVAARPLWRRHAPGCS